MHPNSCSSKLPVGRFHVLQGGPSRAPGKVPVFGLGCVATLLLLGSGLQAQQPPPGVILPPAPVVPAQPPTPPELLGAVRLPAVPIAPPASTVGAPVTALVPKVLTVTPLTPGKLDPAMLSWPDGADPAHRAGLLPQVGVNPVGVLAGAPDAIVPGQRRGTFESVGLLLSDDGKVTLPAAVSLRFAAAQQGKSAWVHPVDGGLIEGQAGGRFMTVGPGGLIAFAFQPPTRTGLYHVIVRLEDVRSELPFWVLKAKDLLDARTPVEHTLQPLAVTVTAAAPATN